MTNEIYGMTCITFNSEIAPSKPGLLDLYVCHNFGWGYVRIGRYSHIVEVAAIFDVASNKVLSYLEP